MGLARFKRAASLLLGQDVPVNSEGEVIDSIVLTPEQSEELAQLAAETLILPDTADDWAALEQAINDQPMSVSQVKTALSQAATAREQARQAEREFWQDIRDRYDELTLAELRGVALRLARKELEQ